ncbi:helix-turn-helix protein [Anaerobacterium chartisolvens]|uniref:Stage 0 sporulation protein A homolog n=1 Tax=Anaerobacterium chartisolvens TaxID=1297424 RepID=A0A369BBS4_9FIRM|nr:response regulator [Anaerobacterium chartisolvens]RCX18861.1 helix-turn-helix protein [Anaerobacterium chartisolvens]
MIRVIVVEDEPPILNAVAKMIEELHSDFHVVGKAPNGEDALELAEKLKPDVVFTDIKMPVMDGLTLIEKLMHMKPAPIPVVLSGYAEFEFAKRAFSHGTFDYLIKPINLDVLEELLNRIAHRIYQTIKDRETTVLDQIIRNNASGGDGAPSLYITDLFPGQSYACMLICAGSYCSYHSPLLTPGQEFWARNNMEEIIGKNVKDRCRFWITDGEHDNEKILLLGSKSGSNIDISMISKEIYLLLASYGTPVTALVSLVFQDIMQVGARIRKLQGILKRDICFGFSQYIQESPAAEVIKKSDHDILHPSWENSFHTAIAMLQADNFKSNLKSLLAICEDRKCRQYILEKILQQIFTLFCKIPELNLTNHMVDIHMELNEIITCSISYEGIFENLSCLTEELFYSKPTTACPNTEQDDAIDRIDAYIKINFTVPINLQMLSDVFGFAPQYLGRKYKKVRGRTPNDYIIELRMNKAKELLKEKSMMSIKDIAEAVGYEDPFYFSRVFKLYTGKTASEFRELQA